VAPPRLRFVRARTFHFVKYVHQHAHALEPKIVGVETVDHPTDGQIVAYAKTYFLAADRLR
jgi:hypothetical protein